MVRLSLTLTETTDWAKLFDAHGGCLFVPTDAPPETGAEVRVDLIVTDGGPRVVLKGTVLWSRADGGSRDAAGCSVGLPPSERAKVNFVNGFVRGGLIDRREKRRLPLRLPVTYGGLDGPRSSFSRDINEEGLFIVADDPFPEETVLHVAIGLPGNAAPLTVRGVVSHTVILEDEDVPGMGVVFQVDAEERARVKAVVDSLEAAFLRDALPEDVIS